MAGTDKTPLFGTKGDKTNLRIRRHVFQDTGHFQQYTCAGGIIVGSRRIAHRVMMGTDNDDLTRVMIGVGPLGGNHVVRSGSTGKGERLHLHIIITVSLKFLHQIFNRLQFSIRSGHSRTDHLGQMVNVTVDIIHLDPFDDLIVKGMFGGIVRCSRLYWRLHQGQNQGDTERPCRKFFHDEASFSFLGN